MNRGSNNSDENRLVALVAGATRGAGRGIACALGECGATVICTGRSSRMHPRNTASGGEQSPFATEFRPETIEETAELVEKAGGHGIAKRVDHSNEAEIHSLAEEIREKYGRLDVIVDDIWGGDAWCEWGKPGWELDCEQGKKMWEQGVWTHILTSRQLVPLLLKSSQGVLIEITDGDSLAYRGNFFYDLVKTMVIRMAFSWSEELHQHGVTSVAITPGFLRSEAMLEHLGVTRSNWQLAAEKDPNFLVSESPWFVGRAVAALVMDPERFSYSGQVLSSWGLAKKYGFTDEDGTQPDWGTHASQNDFGKEQAQSHQRFVNAFNRKD
jgi:NAD(P)-dependent dehydrogenase (short-subunit alcohol dehydrogenase family)